MSSDNYDNNTDKVERCFGIKHRYNRSDCVTAKDWEDKRCESYADFSTYTQGIQIYLCSKCSKRGLIYGL